MVAWEKDKVKGAIRTDFILSAEIIVLTLGVVATASFTNQILTLSVVALAMTVFVYGLVAGIVKLDDVGLYLSRKGGAIAAFGRGLVASAPWLMKFLSVAGTIAMFLVGGGILVHNVPALHHAVQALGGEGSGLAGERGGQHGGRHHRRRHRAGSGDRVPEAAREMICRRAHARLLLALRRRPSMGSGAAAFARWIISPPRTRLLPCRLAAYSASSARRSRVFGIVTGPPPRQPEMHRHAPVLLVSTRCASERAAGAARWPCCRRPGFPAVPERTRRRPTVRCRRRAQQQPQHGHQVLQQHRHPRDRAPRWSGGNHPGRSRPRPAVSCCARHAPVHAAAVVQAAAIQCLGQRIDTRQVTGSTQVPAPARQCVALRVPLPAARWPGDRGPAQPAAAPPVSRITSRSSWLRSAMLRASRSCSA